MNEELKNKIESAKKDETYWNDEAMVDDLIKQGYKKEDIDNILKVSVIETIAKKKFKLLMPFLICPFLGVIFSELLIWGFIVFLMVTGLILVFINGSLDTFLNIPFYLWFPFIGYIVGLLIGIVIYRKKIKKLSFEQLSLLGHNTILIITTSIISGILSFIVCFLFYKSII